MTFTITAEQFYIGIIVILLAIQVYHQVQIKKLQTEIEKIWSHAAMVAAALSMHLSAAEKQESEKQDKE